LLFGAIQERLEYLLISVLSYDKPEVLFDNFGYQI
jgi:hypothetical protein